MTDNQIRLFITMMSILLIGIALVLYNHAYLFPFFLSMGVSMLTSF